MVASSEKQINFLRKLKENALENGVNTKLINANKSSFLEPNLNVMALYYQIPQE